jgi:putative DNA primase/helicase
MKIKPTCGSIDPKNISIKRNTQIEPKTFPHQPATPYGAPPATIENIAHLLDAFGIVARFNIITKKVEVLIPGHGGSVENAANTAITHVQSLALRYGITTGAIPATLDLLADQNPYNPVRTWIESKAWDGKDRLPAICATLVTAEDFPTAFRDVLVRKWLLSATAAAMLPDGFRCRGVLTLQGPQGLGKTSWGRNLVPASALGAEVIRLDHHLDGNNKDSVLIAISHWIVEIGELESSFKRDVARLKGFLTQDTDKVRRPYAKEATEYRRRTVFFATVNSFDFLIDGTGNARFWTLPLIDVNHDHGIDMQQVFAQLAIEIQAGEQWWLTDEEEQQLAKLNARHRAFSPVLDLLQAYVDFDAPEAKRTEACTATEILVAAGLERPSNLQVKEGAALLREHLGPPKRIRGRDKYRFAKKPDDDASNEVAYDPNSVDEYDEEKPKFC